MGKLDGKVALVTGSGRGIGRALALKLSGDGASVVVNDLDDAPAAETVAEIVKRGGKAVACNGSVVADGFSDRFVKTAMDSFGGVDIIVNNAGYTWDSVIQKMTDKQFQDILDVHLVAPFRILRAASEPIRAFAKQESAEGRVVMRKVVNISSIAGTGGGAGQATSSSAKMGVIGLPKALAKEWGRYNVNVNCVAFGLIQTRLTQPLNSDGASINIEGTEIAVGIQQGRINASLSSIPLGRAGTPEDAANSVYLFCIPESDYISGQTIVCGGGHGYVM